MRIGSNRDEGGQRGFSMVELSVVIFFLGVVAVTVIPNLATLTRKTRSDDASRQIQGGMQLARMKSINERVDHVLQFSAKGFNIFRDLNSNGTRDTGEPWLWVTDTRLKADFGFRSPVAPGTGDPGSLAVSGCKCLRYRPNGTVVVSSGSTVSQYLDIGDGREYRRVNVSTAGAVKVQRWRSVPGSWE